MWLPMYPAPPVTRIFMMLCLIRAVEPPSGKDQDFRGGEKLVENTILRFRAEIKRKNRFFRKKALLRGGCGAKNADKCAHVPGQGAIAGRQAARARRHLRARKARVSKILTFYRVRLDFSPARDYNIHYFRERPENGFPARTRT